MGRGRHRHQVVKLENETHVGRPPVGQGPLPQGGDVDTADLDRAGGCLVDARDEVEQGALARAAGAHQRHKLAGLHREVKLGQHRDELVAPAVGLAEVADADERIFGRVVGGVHVRVWKLSRLYTSTGTEMPLRQRKGPGLPRVSTNF